MSIVDKRRSNYFFAGLDVSVNSFLLPLTCRRKGTATYCVTMTFQEVLRLVVDGISRGRERRAETFKTCPLNLLEFFGMDAILVSSYEYIVRE